jgi:hypothetical protein
VSHTQKVEIAPILSVFLGWAGTEITVISKFCFRVISAISYTCSYVKKFAKYLKWAYKLVCRLMIRRISQ